MKSVGCCLVICLSLGLLGTAEETETEQFQSTFAKASFDFTLDLLKVASKEVNENVLFSPSSISVLLAILQQGAQENTAAQLEKVLHLSAEDSKTGYGNIITSLQGERENWTLEWGNRAFVVPGFSLREEFLETIEDKFNATFEELDFKTSSAQSAAAKINDWVKEATHDTIKDLVDDSLLNQDVVMVMVNAIFFKSVWDSPFEKHKTMMERFNLDQGDHVDVPFMRQSGRFFAGEDTDIGLKWLDLPFKYDNFSMVFILPNETIGLSQMMEKLSGATLRDIIGSTETRRVRLQIPKFQLVKKVSLADTLKELGLTDIFSNEANLGGISDGDVSLMLSQLIHQANVEIDEEGSTAAAATLEIVQTLSLEIIHDELFFRLNRPFLFFIVDKQSKVPIFAGKIANPKALLSE